MAVQTAKFSARNTSLALSDEQKVFSGLVTTVLAGNSVTVDARGMVKLSVEALATAVVLVSRVNAEDAAVHGTGPKVIVPPAAGALLVVDVDWPFYLISTSTGDAEVVLV